jgi:hypothetical protein
MSAAEQGGRVQPAGEQSSSFDFEKAIADIKRAAEVLTRPEAKDTLQAIQDAAKAVAAVTDAVKAVAVSDAVKAVAVQDAVKAVAVSDAVKAVAVQDAVKAVAGLVSDAREQIRGVLAEEIARAVQMVRDAASSGNPSKKDER